MLYIKCSISALLKKYEIMRQSYYAVSSKAETLVDFSWSCRNFCSGKFLDALGYRVAVKTHNKDHISLDFLKYSLSLIKLLISQCNCQCAFCSWSLL